MTLFNTESSFNVSFKIFFNNLVPVAAIHESLCAGKGLRGRISALKINI